jgi:hypothetical protein
MKRLERDLVRAVQAESSNIQPESNRDRGHPGSSRLVPIAAKIGPALSRAIDDYADAQGISRSRAAGQLLEIAQEALRAREGVSAGKAQEILEALEGLRTVVELVGPPTFGILRLLSHWATQTGGLKVSEDELLAELRTVAADEWEQVLSEAERDLHLALKKADSEGKK